MSPMCVHGGKYEPRVDCRLDNIKRGVKPSFDIFQLTVDRRFNFASRTQHR